MRNIRALLVIALALAGCSESDETDPSGHGGGGDGIWECFGANDCLVGQYCNDFHVCVPLSPNDADGGRPAPPEVEAEDPAPAGGLRYVYVALTSLDAVARIDAETLNVTSLDVGDQPTSLVTLPGQDLAVVLNQGDPSLSILRTDDLGQDHLVTLPSPPSLNRLAMGPLGLHALAYYRMDNPDLQGPLSFQDLAIVHLDPGQERLIEVSVGFRPSEVVFSEDEARAYVITEDGVSILDLDLAAQGFIAPTVALSPDPLDQGAPDEVVVPRQGTQAFARWAGLDVIRAVDLTTGTITDTPLDSSPTDLDLTPDGLTLLAVVQNPPRIIVMALPDAIGRPEALRTIDCSPLPIGSVQIAPDGQRALAYTNASNEKAVTLVDLASDTPQAIPLRKGVRSVAFSPDSTTVLILHNKLPGDPAPSDDFDTQLDKRQGYSVVSLDSLFVKLQVTDARPGDFVFSSDSTMAHIIVADESLREVQSVLLESYIVSAVTVASPPVGIGEVAGLGKIYISQDYPMGRLSFLDTALAQVRTVTGFQLNSQVVE